jgi:hypothetical protein
MILLVRLCFQRVEFIYDNINIHYVDFGTFLSNVWLYNVCYSILLRRFDMIVLKELIFLFTFKDDSLLQNA